MQEELDLPLQAIQATLTLRPEGYILGEPIQAQFSLRNMTHQSLEVDMGFRRTHNFAFSFIDPDWRSAYKTRLREHGGVSLDPIVHLLPGPLYQQTLILDEWFPICIPGQYDLEWEGPIVNLEVPQVLSGNASFLVKSRDAAYLEQLCIQLTTSESSRPPDWPACHLLSYVRDPIAIPYLLRICEGDTPSVELRRSEAIDGLRRIGTEEAVAAMKTIEAKRLQDLIAEFGPIDISESDRPLKRVLPYD